eukprot:m.70388 g.70388  ORF g.70388 m.70388 type:complete len:368 (-) comp14293_c0_seq1:197-1300(-)
MADITVIVTDVASGTERAFQLTLDMELLDLLALIEVELQIPTSEAVLSMEGVVFSDPSATLEQAGLFDGAQLQVIRQALVPAPAAASAAGAGAGGQPSAAALASALASLAGQYMGTAGGGLVRRPQDRTQELLTLRNQLRADRYQLSNIQENNPEFAAAILGDNFDEFRRHIEKIEESQMARRKERARLEALLREDEFNVEAQAALEEEIRMENVEALRQQAIEHMPESFASVVMLYIDVEVNGVKLKAFVDSGAQMTIMSVACAERCGIMRLVDKRFQGMAVGVGTQKIVGRVHMHSVVIAGNHLPTSFSILENQPMDMLLGLDMLRRHQCILDLKNNKLVIGTTGSSTPFLSEADLPPCARLKEH